MIKSSHFHMWEIFPDVWRKSIKKEKRSKMKKFFALLLALVMSLSLVACGGGDDATTDDTTDDATNEETGGETTNDYKISVVLKTLSSEYWGYVKAGCDAAAAELGVKVSVVGPGAESDIEGQVAQIEQQIGAGCDAIICAPNDAGAAANALQTALDQGIPVLSVDTDVGIEGQTTFVGTSNVDAAYEGGKWAIGQAGDGAKAVIIYGQEGDNTSNMRREGYQAFFLAIDCSGSMAEPIHFRGGCKAKSEVVATIANELLFELIERARRSDGVRDYYDIAVLGYHGDDEVTPLLADRAAMHTVCELAAMEPRIRTELLEYRLPDGGISLREIPTPCWVEPRAEGQTPMCEALRRIRDLAAEWVLRPENAESFPPVVFNITDGEATDCDGEELRTVAEQIRSLATADGNVLLVNIHIATAADMRPLLFPEPSEEHYANRYASLLYDCSSTLPEPFHAAIRELKGAGALPPFRGLGFNASAAELVSALNIGSISVKTE